MPPRLREHWRLHSDPGSGACLRHCRYQLVDAEQHRLGGRPHGRERQVQEPGLPAEDHLGPRAHHDLDERMGDHVGTVRVGGEPAACGPVALDDWANSGVSIGPGWTIATRTPVRCSRSSIARLLRKPRSACLAAQ